MKTASQMHEHIKDRVDRGVSVGKFTLFDLVAESKYQGVPHYLYKDVDAGYSKVCDMLQALDVLEGVAK